MARYAQVLEAGGFVVNVIEWDGNEENWRPPPGYVMIEDVNGEAWPGCTYVDGAFVPPPSGEPAG